MFRESVSARYVLRGVVAMAISMSAVAGTIWIDNPYVKLTTAGVAALSAYLGIGAVVPQVEPFVGKKLENAEVPSPPAVKEN